MSIRKQPEHCTLSGWHARREVQGLHESAPKCVPAGRRGVPDDFAGIAAFLAATVSDFVTAAAITVDGGFSVQGWVQVDRATEDCGKK
jgi:NAD(P)-dependent dehydrogenase (short-subunit alcohol dehydrogenase family)